VCFDTLPYSAKVTNAFVSDKDKVWGLKHKITGPKYKKIKNSGTNMHLTHYTIPL
jgi:hypothetical protein